ncbi:hypothetical protein [Chiayiivirga flava]|uniref:Lipoprotein n=1 Tax=Chiayiivirga flava TaxID=659595 RepID=A0A7W8D4M3_9GAMM|nr:hypothetical protein [Chiayiivirga flava]MBB5207853.1 hypothetical protein [Chiayiivirga flava]
MRQTIAGAIVLLALVACSSEPPPPPPQAREEDKALQHAIQAPLDKARAVEDEVLKAQQDQQRTIDEQGG